MRAGDRILHPEHGTGAVLALKYGRRVRVRFDAATEAGVIGEVTHALTQC